MKLNFLSGITLSPFLRLAVRYREHLDWRYAHRLAFLLCMSIFTSVVGCFESLLYGWRISRQALHPAPLIILGHPRTGTTHLHNLLSRDERWAFATTWQAGFPSTFLLLAPFRALLAPLLDATRPMDAVALHWELPTEDEVATCCLSGGESPYMALVFPRSLRWWTMFDVARAPASQAAAWESAFLFFCRKVTYAASRGGAPKPLLLKSPVHTARIATLRRLFPSARFVYAHRHPLDVFASAAHMADAYYNYTYLQPPASAEALQDFILRQGVVLHSEYVRQRAALPAGALSEVSFAELDAAPARALARVYRELRLGDYNASLVAAAVERYAATLRGFRKNDHRALGEGLEGLVRRRWAAAFAEHGYE